MIQLNTNLSIIDNSGAKNVKCIKILGGSFKGSLDRIVVAIQNVLPNRKVKSGDVSQSLVVRLKKKRNVKTVLQLIFLKILQFY